MGNVEGSDLIPRILLLQGVIGAAIYLPVTMLDSGGGEGASAGFPKCHNTGGKKLSPPTSGFTITDRKWVAIIIFSFKTFGEHCGGSHRAPCTPPRICPALSLVSKLHSLLPLVVMWSWGSRHYCPPSPATTYSSPQTLTEFGNPNFMATFLSILRK